MKFVEMALHQHCTPVRFWIQHPHTLGRPSRAGVRVGWINSTPVSDGWPRVRGQLGWLIGQSVVSNFIRYSGAQIHSLGRRTFQAVSSAKCVCEHTSLTHLTTSTKYTCEW